VVDALDQQLVDEDSGRGTGHGCRLAGRGGSL